MASHQRVPWIDAARGVGIILVVWGHMWRGIAQAGILPNGPLFHWVDRLVYSFHMPLFFLLSGLFMQFALRPGPLWQSILERCARLLWPLALWFYLFEALRLAAGNSINTPNTLQDLAVLPFPGQLHFWFLWALFCLHILSLLAVRLFGRWKAPTEIWRLLLLLSLAAGAIFAVVEIPPSVLIWLGNAVRYAPFFFLAAAFAPQIRAIAPGPGAAILAGLVFVGLAPIASGGPLVWPLGLLLALAMSGAVLIFSAYIDRPGQDTATTRLLETLGRYSLPIYVSHTIFSAALRVLLLEAGITSMPIHIVLGVFVGLAGPILLYRAARSLGLLKVLGFS